jgi:hypothetical protein
MEIFIFYELRKKGGNKRLCHERLCPENKALNLMFYYDLKLYWMKVCLAFMEDHKFVFSHLY